MNRTIIVTILLSFSLSNYALNNSQRNFLTGKISANELSEILKKPVFNRTGELSISIRKKESR